MTEQDRVDAEVPEWRANIAKQLRHGHEPIDLFFAIASLCNKVEELEVKIEQLGKEQ